MKMKETSNKDLSFGIFTTVVLLQLIVAVAGCHLWAINVQNYMSKSNLPSLFEWLQTWDGAEGKMGQTVHKKSSSMSWLTKKAFFKITVITEWCLVHYTSCLLLCFVSQAVVIVLMGRKRLTGTSMNCLLWFVLLTNSWRRAMHFRLWDVLLSSFTCCISLYLFMMCSAGDRIFGQVSKKRKKRLEVKVNWRDNQNNEGDTSSSNNTFANKLKLPEELMFADEKYSLDDNIGSLSLGPPIEDTKQRGTTGSWFCSKVYPGIGETDIVKDKHPTNKNTLIWPAKFHRNGLSLKSRVNKNGLCESKKQKILQEFSDEEFCSFSDCDEEKTKTKRQNNCRKADVNITTTKNSACNKRCNLLRFILMCSLALNVWLLWLVKGSIRKALHRT